MHSPDAKPKKTPFEGLVDADRQACFIECLTCIKLKCIMHIAQLRQADLNLLVVFAVLAEERNVSRAGARLLLGQPAVSRALQRLREMFHDDLFVRSGHSYVLTPQGQRLFEEIRVILPKLNDFLSAVKFDPAIDDTKFRIAATDNATSLLVPILTRDVIPKARKILFDFVAWEDKCFDSLASGCLDLVLNADEGSVPPAFEREVIYKESLCCVVSAGSKHAQGLTLKQYLSAEHISVSVFANSQVIPEKRLADVGETRNIVFRVPYFETAIRAVANTRLIATVPLRLAQSESHNPAVKIISAPSVLTGFDYVMAWQSRFNTDAAHQWLRATIRDIARTLSTTSDPAA